MNHEQTAQRSARELSNLAARLVACAVALVAVCMLAACEPETKTVGATQVVVSVNSDLRIGTDLARIDVELFAVDSLQSAIERRSFELTGARPLEGEVRVPFSFGISKNKADRFLLVMTGYGFVGTNQVETQVIEQKVIASFQAGQTLLLKVFLGKVCFESMCTNEETCYPTPEGDIEAGSCGPIMKARTSRIAPGEERDVWKTDAIDAGADAGADAGGDDGGPDDAGPMQCGMGLEPSDGGCVPVCNPATSACNGCPKGYVPTGSGCGNLDECSIANGGCAQGCTDANGSYACSCQASYKLAADAHACDLLSWTNAMPVGEPVVRTSQPHMVMRSSGAAYAVWEGSNAGSDTNVVFVSEYSTGRLSWSEPKPLDPDAAVDTGGIQIANRGSDTVAWWTRLGQGVWFSRITTGMQWSAPQLVTDVFVQDFRGAIDSQGNVMFTWVQDTEVWARYYDASLSALQAAVFVGGGGNGGSVPNGTAITSQGVGKFIAAWVHFRDTTDVIAYSRFVEGTGWAAEAVLVEGRGRLGEPALATDGGGDALLAWDEEDGTQIAWGLVPSAGTAERKGLIASNLEDARFPVILFDPTNAATLVWRAATTSADERIHWSRRPPGGVFGPATQIPTTSAARANRPAAAVDGEGNVIVTWSEYTAEIPETVWWSRCLAGKPCSAASLLQTVTQDVQAVSEPVVAMDYDGRAIALWSQRATGGDYVLFERRLQ